MIHIKIFFQDWTDLGEGWLYGQWETGRFLSFFYSFFAHISKIIPGPWIGFKTPEKAVGSYGWVGVPNQSSLGSSSSSSPPPSSSSEEDNISQMEDNIYQNKIIYLRWKMECEATI